MEYCWDFETTGRTATDTITVIGALATDTGTYHAHYLEPPEMDLEDVPDIEERLQQELPDEVFEGGSGINEIVTHGYRNEEYLIEGFQLQIVGADNPNAVGEMFVGFYSNRYDLPTLRTRALKVGMEWRLNGGTSRDLWDAFKYKFATDIVDVSGLNKPKVKQFAEQMDIPINKSDTKAGMLKTIEAAEYSAEDLDTFVSEQDLDRPTTNVGGLDELYSLLIGDEIFNDPLEDGGEAVTAYEDGNIGDVVLHNVADLLKTRRLNEAVTEYVSEQEIKDRAI